MSVNITNGYASRPLTIARLSRNETANFNLASKILNSRFGDRRSYTSQSYWSAIDIDNPQKKTQLTIENYQIKHQGINALNIVLEYSYHYEIAVSEALSTDSIYRQINSLLLNYPNEEDFWEVMNCYISEQILKLNPLLSEVRTVIVVHPNGEFPYYRSSTVNQTSCGKRQETWHFNFPLSFISSLGKSSYAPYKVSVDYTYKNDASEFPYPDFMIIYSQLENLLVAHNWQNHFWSKTQSYLEKLLQQQNSTLTSVSVGLESLI